MSKYLFVEYRVSGNAKSRRNLHVELSWGDEGELQGAYYSIRWEPRSNDSLNNDLVQVRAPLSENWHLCLFVSPNYFDHSFHALILHGDSKKVVFSLDEIASIVEYHLLRSDANHIGLSVPWEWYWGEPAAKLQLRWGTIGLRLDGQLNIPKLND